MSRVSTVKKKKPMLNKGKIQIKKLDEFSMEGIEQDLARD